MSIKICLHCPPQLNPLAIPVHVFPISNIAFRQNVSQLMHWRVVCNAMRHRFLIFGRVGRDSTQWIRSPNEVASARFGNFSVHGTGTWKTCRKMCEIILLLHNFSQPNPKQIHQLWSMDSKNATKIVPTVLPSPAKPVLWRRCFIFLFFCFFLRVSPISPRLRYICLCVLSGVLVRLFGLFPFACERLLWKVRQLFLKTVSQFLGIGFWDLPALACNHSRRYRAVALSRWHEIFLHLEWARAGLHLADRIQTMVGNLEIWLQHLWNSAQYFARLPRYRRIKMVMAWQRQGCRCSDS